MLNHIKALAVASIPAVLEWLLPDTVQGLIDGHDIAQTVASLAPLAMLLRRKKMTAKAISRFARMRQKWRLALGASPGRCTRSKQV